MLSRVYTIAIFAFFGCACIGLQNEATAQTTFFVNKEICEWTNAPTPPVPNAKCNPYPGQVLPGDPVYYRVQFDGAPNSAPWDVTLNESYPPGFANNVQNVDCAVSGSSTSIFSLSSTTIIPPTTSSLGPILVPQGQTVFCTMAGFFSVGTGLSFDATNNVGLIATSASGDTGVGGKNITRSVDPAAPLPTNLSIAKTADVSSVLDGGQITFQITINNASVSNGGSDVFLASYLRVVDEIRQNPSSTLPLTATLVGPPTCSASGGATCPSLSNSNTPKILSTIFDTFLIWQYPSGSGGFFPAGGQITLTYSVKVDSTVNCFDTNVGHILDNRAFLYLHNQTGTPFPDSNPSDNQSATTDIDVITALPPCAIGPGDVTLTKTRLSSTGSNVPWNMPVTYEVILTNNSPYSLTDVSIEDMVKRADVTPPFNVIASSVSCTNAPCTIVNNSPKQIISYNSWAASQILWSTSGPLTLAPNSNLKISMVLEYDYPSCSDDFNWSAVNEARASFKINGTLSPFIYTDPDPSITLADPPTCDFTVDKSFVGGTPPIIQFDTQYSYQVNITNNLGVPATMHTLADSLKISITGYANALPLEFRYDCTDNGVTGYAPAQNSNYPSYGPGPTNIVYSPFSLGGSPIFYKNSASGIIFGPGSTLSCKVDIKIKRPLAGDPNCMGTGAASLQNSTLISSSYNYSFNSTPDNFSFVSAPLPICYNLQVNKIASPATATTTGPLLTYALEVVNEGDDISGLTTPDWFVLNDFFPQGYTPGAVQVSVTNPVGPGCDLINPPSPSDNCEWITAGGNPIKLAIKNLQEDQILTLTFPVAPPFTLPDVRNDATIEAQGTLITNGYAWEPNTMATFMNVPITQGNPDDYSEICVKKFNDQNANGVKDSGEPWLSGWQFDVSGPSGAVLISGVTDQNGEYCTGGILVADTYIVAEIIQSGWTNTKPGGGNTSVSVVLSGQDSQTIEFGNTEDDQTGGAQGQICIRKFNDTNANGVKDPGEAWLSGWQFDVTGSGGVIIATGSTNEEGVYCTLNSLPADTYTVAEILQNSWTNTVPGGASPSIDVIITGNDVADVIFGNCQDCEIDTGGAALKICKVAGDGVDIGTDFFFNVTGVATAVSVPAGPAPGGYCAVVGIGFDEGDIVTVGEIGPDGYGVTDISLQSLGQLLNVDLDAGIADIEIGSGVTELIYTNHNTTGYIEICKTGEVTGDFSFTIEPGAIGPITVPAGACSPAIAVTAGDVIIHEMANPGTMMSNCSTIPADRQGECDLDDQTSVVSVPAGDISTQTIVFIENIIDGSEPLYPVTIRKIIEDPSVGAGADALGLEFEIELTCNGQSQGSMMLSAGELASFGPIPSGTQCTVSEIIPEPPTPAEAAIMGCPAAQYTGTGWSYSASPQNFTVGDDPVTVTVENTLRC